MEELKDTSIHKMASKLINAIKSLNDYTDLFKNVQKLACNPNVDKNDMRQSLEEAIRESGLETEIRNLIFQLIRTNLKIDRVFDTEQTQPQVDPLAYLRRAGAQWDRRVRKSLHTMCAELKVYAQGQPRTSSDRDELLAKWDELSNYAIDLACYRPVYAPKDLLDVLLSMKGPPIPEEQEDDLVQIPKWEFSHIPLKVKKLCDLGTHYNDLLREESYYSVWDLNIQCERVLAMKHATLCQHILKKGNIPATYRGAMWSYVLGSHITDFDVDYWNKLKGNVLSTDHIVDKLVFKDIQLTASNDDQYFVFEDVLYQIMLCFSRDTQIGEMVLGENYHQKPKTYEAPPSGVVPFHGICMFAAPFCYLFDSPIHLYYSFRAFYVRYCHRLTTINTHPQGIVSICLLFEKLLQSHEPKLWSHFRELQIHPIRVVFKWLMRAFSGHLPPDQLLVLWDLILGFDSLEILSLFAIIILSFRKESILQVVTLENIDAILADLSSIKVIPLIKLALSRD
ncbi:TBC1 domain family member 19 isoform X1 [Glossina fuscipes]|uniref:TBC1 domain family member 19 isoform X1 n=1 Tax=Glossina fuscipes TaxID=7396 RepID=A0A8U0WEQ0_9MUSC|nr:TBC1 domain family member 19 isoform X1 [Glossina fuscipes]